MTPTGCPFCNLPPERILLESPATMAFLDGYPVSEGHAVVIPKRHVASIFDLQASERADLHELLFSSERANLTVVRPILEHFPSETCFCCGKPIRGEARQVDHFI